MPGRACTLVVLSVALTLVATLAGCDLENPGDEPPVGALYFPNALALSRDGAEAPRFLFVASTNFDLRYTSGALHAFSLDAIDEAIMECAAGDSLGAEECSIDLREALADEVFIPTYATAIGVDPDGERIVVSSRTEGALTVVEVNPDATDASGDPGAAIASDLLSCGAADSRGCGTATTAAIDSISGERFAQPPAPSDLLVGRLSELTGDPADEGRDYVAAVHQRGAVSLYVDTRDDRGRESLQLSSIIDDLGRTPTSIARDPTSGLLHVTLRSNSLVRLGVAVDPDSERGAAELFPMAPVSITGGTFSDFRSVAFLEQPVGLGVAPGESQALVIANNPSSLVLANVTPGSFGAATGRLQRIAEIGEGGARIAVGSVGGRPLAAVTCLDGRSIYVVDLTSMEVRAVVPNLSGPYGIAFDEARERLYATDFRSSVVRIVDLSRLASPEAAPESARVIATLGRPRVVQELK